MKDKLKEGKAICEKHNLMQFLRPETQEAIKDVADYKAILKDFDVFGPVSEPIEDFYILPLPFDKVHMVDSLETLKNAAEKILSAKIVFYLSQTK